MKLSDTARFIKSAATGTTAFVGRFTSAPGRSSVLVGGFIGSASTASEIIDRGINGQPLSIWHGVKFLFFFTIACCHADGLYKTDPRPRAMTESEWFKSQAKPPGT